MLQTIKKNRDVITADLCVLEEQPRHIVLAVRVPRETIAGNQDFLAYIAGTVPPEPQKRSLTRLIGGRVVCATSAVFFAAMAVLMPNLQTAEADNIPSIETMGEASLSEPYDGHHDILKMQIVARRNTLCETVVERSVRRFSDYVMVWQNRGHLDMAISREFRLHKYGVKLPDLELGNYLYISQLHTDCGGGKIEHHANNAVFFTVTE